MRRFSRRLIAILSLLSLILACPGAGLYQAFAENLEAPRPSARTLPPIPALTAGRALPEPGLAPGFMPISMPPAPPPAPAQPSVLPTAVERKPDTPASVRPEAQRSLEAAADLSRRLADQGVTSAQAKADAGKPFQAAHDATATRVSVSAAGAGSDASPLGLQKRPRRFARMPEPPGPGGRSFSKGWLVKVLAATAIFLAMDLGVKALLVHFGLPFVFHPIGPGRQLLTKFVIGSTAISAAYSLGLAHSRESLQKKLEGLRARRPVVGGALAAILYAANFDIFKLKSRLPTNGGDLLEKYPALKTPFRVMDAAWAMLLAGVLGNGLSVILGGGAVDFIPFGHARLNLADACIFLGIPLVEMGRQFLEAARTADETGKPLAARFSHAHILPVLGLVIFYFSTWFGYKDLPEASWYILLFSTLFSVTILLSQAVFERLTETFNKSFIPKP